MPQKQKVTIMKIAKKHNLIVIEDTAQAFGAELNGKKAGTIGDCGAFSLQAGKTITSGEGGFIATNSKKIRKDHMRMHMTSLSADSGLRFILPEYVR